MKLKATKQEVFSLPWVGDQGYCPWDETKYTRILITAPKPTKKGNRAQAVIVRRTSVFFK